MLCFRFNAGYLARSSSRNPAEMASHLEKNLVGTGKQRCPFLKRVYRGLRKEGLLEAPRDVNWHLPGFGEIG